MITGLSIHVDFINHSSTSIPLTCEDTFPAALRRSSRPSDGKGCLTLTLLTSRKRFLLRSCSCRGRNRPSFSLEKLPQQQQQQQRTVAHVAQLADMLYHWWRFAKLGSRFSILEGENDVMMRRRAAPRPERNGPSPCRGRCAPTGCTAKDVPFHLGWWTSV